MNARTISILSGVVLAFACSVWAAEQKPPARSDATNQPSWIDLPSALQLAGAQNLDIQIARARLTEAQANHAGAREQFFPWLVPGAVYRRHEGRIQAVEGPLFDTDKQSYAVGGALIASVDLGDAIYKSLASKQLVVAADRALESQRQGTILAAAEGYFNLAVAAALVGVAREALNISSDYQEQLHQAVQAGIAFKGDELRVQVQTERYRIVLRQAQEQQRIAAARLAQILRLNSSVELFARAQDVVPLALVETNAALSALVGLALRQRPEIRLNEALVSAAEETKNGAVYGPLIPSMTASAAAGGLGGGQGSAAGNFSSSEDYLVGVGWRIGPGGLFDGPRIKAGKARLEAAKLGGEKVRDEIARQVVEAHTHVQSLADQLSVSERNLSAAAETLRLTRERKLFGVGAVLEDIQAQQDLTRARSDYLNTIAEFDKAQYVELFAQGAL